MFNASSIRLNKYISESGICSRRDADRFIEQGNVFINGKRAVVGDKVTPGDMVKVNGQLIEPREVEDLVFIAVNKPAGIVSTTESSERDNIVDFVRHSTRIFPVGRLDKDSQGLIFLTNNGDLVNKILRAGNDHEKEYLVTVNKPIHDDFISGMANGVPILGTKTRKCKISKEAPNAFRITLTQGLNRQIRRMCEYFGYDVVRLERTRIMNVDVKGIAVGEWRDLTEKEMKVLMNAIADSSSEAPAGRKSSRKQTSQRQGGQRSGQGRSAKGSGRSAGGRSENDNRSNGKPAGGRRGSSGRNKPPGSGRSSEQPRGRSKPGGRSGNKPAGRGQQKAGNSGTGKRRR